jgi:hypothetical protein
MLTRCMRFGVLAIMALALLPGANLQAAGSGSGNAWRFDLAPLYLWGLSLEGDASLGTPVGSVNPSIDVPFDDVFSNLEGVFTVHFEGVKDNRWGFFFDYNFLDISGDQDLPLNSQYRVEFSGKIAELAGFYRFAGAPEHEFDVLFGARYTDLEVTANLSGLVNLGASGSQDWTDPFAGLRWGWQFADQWRFSLRGDVGGFGVGTDLAWQFAGLLHWQPWQHVGFIGGYRSLYQDFEDGSGTDRFQLDVTIHGPILGLNLTW